MADADRETPLEQYLDRARKTFKGRDTIDLLVMGNEAADLDSMVSAIAVAFAVSDGKPAQTAVPLIPVPRRDFRLRTEAVYLFGRAGIRPSRLIFSEDLDPAVMAGRVRRLALVDHNRLSPPFSAWGGKVDIIIDHHPDQGRYAHARTRIIEPVGSCATLAAEMLPGDGLPDSQTALLLAGTILLDTVNLDPGAGRTAPKDANVAERLLSRLDLDRQAFYQALRHAKSDTSGLDSSDLLRRDFKTGTVRGLKWGISSIPLSVDAWRRREPDLSQAMARHAAAEALDILISMHTYSDREFCRDLGIFSPVPAHHDRVERFLYSQPLDLARMPSGRFPPNSGISFHRQANTAISRKKLIPILDRLPDDPARHPGSFSPV